MISFSTWMKAGSYRYLINRQLQICKQIGLECSENNPNADIHVYYTTFSRIQEMKIYPGKVNIAVCDTATLNFNVDRVKKMLDKGVIILTPSLWNHHIMRKYVYYHPHIVPELPEQPHQSHLFIAGISERDYDRKGHYWGHVAEQLGYHVIHTGRWQYLYGTPPDEQYFKLLCSARYLLAMSHSESPYLPLIESASCNTPAIYLDAHEFHLLSQLYDLGIPIKASYRDVRSRLNFFHNEVDPYSFVDTLVNLEDKHHNIKKMYNELNHFSNLKDYLNPDELKFKFQHVTEAIKWDLT